MPSNICPGLEREIQLPQSEPAIHEQHNMAGQKVEKRKRSRNITSFNPPYAANIKTNVGKIFRSLVHNHFSGDQDLNRLFNKNNLKISYCTLPNIKSTIAAHNKGLIRKFRKECACFSGRFINTIN